MDESPPPVHEAIVAPGALPRRMWLVTLLGGAVLWASVAVAILLTENTMLVLNLILLGTFLVPVWTLLFALSSAPCSRRCGAVALPARLRRLPRDPRADRIRLGRRPLACVRARSLDA